MNRAFPINVNLINERSAIAWNIDCMCIDVISYNDFHTQILYQTVYYNSEHCNEHMCCSPNRHMEQEKKKQNKNKTNK